MKNLSILFLTFLLLISCGGDKKSTEAIIESGNLEALRAKRAEIVLQQSTINEELTAIDNAISKLDTVKKLPLVTVFKAEK